MLAPAFTNAEVFDPASHLKTSSYTLADGGSPHRKPVVGWSSLIGIVTAICGNILISVALNTQRYAHIRLHERWVEKRKALKAAQKRAARAGYGTQDNRPLVVTPEQQKADRKRGQNGVKIVQNGLLRSATESRETQPLLSSFNNGAIQQDPDQGPEEQPSEVEIKSYLRSPLWWAGQIMMTVGEAGNFLAYGFAPASIVSPLGVVALASNCIIAPFFLKEPFRKRDFFGVVIAIAGAVTVAMSANDNNPKLGPREIWALIATWEFETYLGLTCGAIVALVIASRKYGHKSIFIDLGLVGLFGEYNSLRLLISTLTSNAM